MKVICLGTSETQTHVKKDPDVFSGYICKSEKKKALGERVASAYLHCHIREINTNTNSEVLVTLKRNIHTIIKAQFQRFTLWGTFSRYFVLLRIILFCQMLLKKHDCTSDNWQYISLFPHTTSYFTYKFLHLPKKTPTQPSTTVI